MRRRGRDPTAVRVDPDAQQPAREEPSEAADRCAAKFINGFITGPAVVRTLGAFTP